MMPRYLRLPDLVVPRILISDHRLTSDAKVVFLAVAGSTGNDGLCSRSLDELSAMVGGMAEGTLRQALNQLVKNGYLLAFRNPGKVTDLALGRPSPPPQNPRGSPDEKVVIPTACDPTPSGFDEVRNEPIVKTGTNGVARCAFSHTPDSEGLDDHTEGAQNEGVRGSARAPIGAERRSGTALSSTGRGEREAGSGSAATRPPEAPGFQEHEEEGPYQQVGVPRARAQTPSKIQRGPLPVGWDPPGPHDPAMLRAFRDYYSPGGSGCHVRDANWDFRWKRWCEREPDFRRKPDTSQPSSATAYLLKVATG